MKRIGLDKMVKKYGSNCRGKPGTGEKGHQGVHRRAKAGFLQR